MVSLTTKFTRRYRFCASHRLHSEQLTEADNRTVYGKCNNPFGHGHDYVLDVTVAGPTDPATGLLLRTADLDQLVNSEILTVFSYRNLNQDVAEFSRLVPTTENVALVIAGRLRNRWKDFFPYSSAWLCGISMQETDRNSFEVVVPRVPSPPHLQASRAQTSLNESVIVNA
jgi:6-pyruvoyltetrahydropterin/6-carboxytetrahydropterin synthase